MFGDGALTFREFVMREPLPLATIQAAVLEFLRGRSDAVLYGAQAVNAYVDEPRMTQDVDLLSPRALELAEEIRDHLRNRFRIAIRLRKMQQGNAYRVYQLRKPANRHLVDIRFVREMPPTQWVAKIQVVTPAELIAGKTTAWVNRQGKPKSGTDWRDIAALLLTFPKLKTQRGLVFDRLQAAGADKSVLKAWKEIVAQDIRPEDDEDY